jgi:predicted amidophosphoribosyltransferase
MMSDEAKVEVKLVPNLPDQMGYRYGCTVCGGEENSWICAADADESVAVCGNCLRDGDLDGKLARTAEAWEQRADAERARFAAHAAHARSLIGRLKVPTFAQWQAAQKLGQLMDYAWDVQDEALEDPPETA